MRVPLPRLPLSVFAAFAALALVAAVPARAQRSGQVPPLYLPQFTQPRADTAAPIPADPVGLRLRIEAVPTRAAPRDPVSPALLLPGGDAARILARLPDLPSAAVPADSFALPARTLPPPRAGRVVLAGFPPPDSAGPARPAGPGVPAPLAVVRGAPQGEVYLAAAVTVSFSQPMVPLSSVGAADARGVPVRLSPQPAGSWRWLDVRTALFTPSGRMPAATEYTVTIPAGTRAATGGVLAGAVQWTFATPALSATGGHPHAQRYGQGSASREPLILIQFDQRVDAAALAARIHLVAGGARRPVRLATAGERAGDAGARALAQQADSATWIALRPVQPLPYDAEVQVVVPAGTPSAEGPRATAMDQSWTFRTYGPLRVASTTCGHVCRPWNAFLVRMSNPLDTAADPSAWVRVEPAIPGMRVVVDDDLLVVAGRTAPNTRYTVRLAQRMRDIHGQTLRGDSAVVFHVLTPEAELTDFGAPMIVLDPAGPRRVSVFSHDYPRLRVRVHRVSPADWPAFDEVQRRRRERWGGTPAGLPGREVLNRVVEIHAGPGEATETAVELDEVLRGAPGQLVVAVEPDGVEDAPMSLAWVQATRIGVAAFVDDKEAAAWATSLADGAPLPGVRVEVAGGAAASTDADGLASVPLPAVNTEARWLAARRGDDVALLPGPWRRAQPGVELLWHAVTDRNLYRPGEEVRFKGWLRRLERSPRGGLDLPRRRADSVAWRALDPRGNEIATGRAALTELGGFDAAFTVPAGANLGEGVVELSAPGEPGAAGDGRLAYQVEEFRRPQYEVTARADEGPHVVGGSAEVSLRAAYFSGGALPGAPVDWNVRTEPATFTPPGWGEWRFGVQGWDSGTRRVDVGGAMLGGETDTQGRHAVRLHFDAALPPRAYTVAAEGTVMDVNRQPWSTTERLLVHPAELYAGLRTERGWLRTGDPIDLSVVAVDLDGRPVPDRPVDVVATRMEWRRGGSAGWSLAAVDSTRCAVVSAANPVACTFATGDRGGVYRVAASVRDARGRPSLTRFDVWVYGGAPWLQGPGAEDDNPERRVTLVADRDAYAPGDTAQVLVQLPFWPARGVLTVRREGLVRTQAVASDGPTLTVPVVVQAGDVPGLHLQLDAVGAHGQAGRPRPTARGTDFASGTVTLAVPPGARTLQLVATPADTVMAPDAPASVAVQVRDAAGRPVPGAEVALVVVDEAVLALTGYRLQNPVDLFHPRWNEGVTDVRLRPWVLLADSASGPGEITGMVVDAQTRQPLAGALVTVDGIGLRTVTDALGNFRLAGVARGQRTVRVARLGWESAARTVVVGDEALPPLRIEMSTAAITLEALVATGARTRVAAFAAAPPAPPMPAPAVALQGKAAGVEVVAGGIAVRANFAALALWAPTVRTDAEGRARVPFILPSNLTRYRVMAVAVSGATRYGAGESAITARQPLMVRPSAPRFLNFGDRFELPVVVQNQTDAPLDVDVAVRGEGVRFTEPGKRVRVAAGDRAEVRIAAETLRPGTATIQVAAVAGGLADAAVLTLPVHTPATAEAFATYGSLAEDGAVDLPLEVPQDAIPAFGGLEVTTSSTALQELTDAFLYLVRYPYECAEQIASRLLAVAALRDVLAEFRAEGLPPAEAVANSVARDLAALQGMQTPEGGFAFWPGGDAWPFVTAHVAHALVRTRGTGYAVPGEMLDASMQYLRGVDSHVPHWYSPAERFAVRSYAAYVRDLARDEGVDDELRTLFAQVRLDTIPLEVGGWLLSAAADRQAFAAERAELLRIINNRATLTASTATFATAYEQGEYLLLHSSRRTDAVVLEALLRTAPESELATRTVRGLLGHRVRGRWNSTQENAWVLLALDRYFRAYEAQTPRFVARLWLGERFAGEHRFTGRTADRHHLEVPMRVLASERPGSLTVGREGAGRLYYRAGLRYAPRDLDLVPLERGFAVERTYEAMDDSADVVRGEDGRWRVRAGARVRITVTATVPSRRVHVALVDPLPAGFEAVNTALLGAQNAPSRGAQVNRGPGGTLSYDRRWWGPWYEHQNMRDDRVEAFTSLLPAGVYTYTYVARATTPGRFIVPPPRAEEMYSPETFGRGATDRVIVEDAGARP